MTAPWSIAQARGVARSMAPTAVDQAISGGTNLLVVAALAQRLAPETFGAFAIAYAGLVLVLGCSRAWLGLPLALSTSRSQHERRRLLGAGCVVVVVATPVVVLGIGTLLPTIVGGATGSAEQAVFLVVAVVTPLVCLQDLARYAAVAAGRPGRAIASDLVWLGGVVVLLAVPWSLPPTVVLMLWAAVVAASALVGLVLTRPLASWSAARAIVAGGRGARAGGAVVTLLAAGTTLAISAIVAIGWSPADSGSLLGAGTLLGPVNLLVAMLDLAVLGQVARRAPLERRRALALVLGVLLAVQLAWTAALVVLPSSIGEVLLGATWEGARTILVLVSVQYAAASAVAVVSLELKARDVGGAMIAARVVGSVVSLGAIGAAITVDAPFAVVPLATLAGTLASLAIVLAAVLRGPWRPRVRVGAEDAP